MTPAEVVRSALQDARTLARSGFPELDDDPRFLAAQEDILLILRLLPYEELRAAPAIVLVEAVLLARGQHPYTLVN